MKCVLNWLVIVCASLVLAACDDDNPGGTGGDGDGTNPGADADAGVEDASSDDVPNRDTADSDSGAPDGHVGSDADATLEDALEGGIPLTSFIETAAAGICDAMFRCCSTTDVDDWFAPIGFNPRFEEMVDELPPNVDVTADSCPALVEEVFTIAPFGPWVTAVENGHAGYDGQAAHSCLEALDAAACGDDVTAALFDGTCLAFNAPRGGDVQRLMFERRSVDGDACTVLSDGVGGGFFGSCDPALAFCCVTRDDGSGSCGIGSAESVGTCQVAGQEGDVCGLFPTLQICATGLDCGLDDRCEAPVDTPLSVGDLCYQDFSLQGRCVESWCDLLGTTVCEPYLEDGAECQMAESCASGFCDTVCSQPTFCRGSE